MKHLAILMILMCAITAASAQELSRKERKAAREKALIETTKTLIDNGNWQFNAEQMLPMQGKSKTLTTLYNVVLKNDTVDSYLPFYGRAYHVEYGATESPMTFIAAISNYSLKPEKKGGWLVKFSTKNKNDVLQYTFSVSENGTSTLNVSSTNRQSISYYGKIVEISAREDE